MNWKDAVPVWNRNRIIQEVNCDPALTEEPDRKTWRFHMESFGYHQKTSFNWFHDSQRNHKTEHIFYWPQSEYEFVHLNFRGRCAPEQVEREWQSAIDIYSLWDFYEMIGYDRKKKCYV